MKVAGQWATLTVAIDRSGDLIDFMSSPRRTAKSARRFLREALRLREDCPPETIDTDQSEAYPESANALALYRFATASAVLVVISAP